MRVGSQLKVDACGVCGGDGASCGAAAGQVAQEVAEVAEVAQVPKQVAEDVAEEVAEVAGEVVEVADVVYEWHYDAGAANCSVDCGSGEFFILSFLFLFYLFSPNPNLRDQ